jgi:hypothetical protein
MTKRPSKGIKPEREPTLADFDVVRRVTGGKTPAETLRLAEQEQRERPLRLLERLRGGKRGKKGA